MADCGLEHLTPLPWNAVSTAGVVGHDPASAEATNTTSSIGGNAAATASPAPGDAAVVSAAPAGSRAVKRDNSGRKILKTQLSLRDAVQLTKVDDLPGSRMSSSLAYRRHNVSHLRLMYA